MRSVTRSFDLAMLGLLNLLTACSYDLLLVLLALVVVVVATAYVVPLETRQRPYDHVPTSYLNLDKSRIAP